jgi:hypothetical protein
MFSNMLFLFSSYDYSISACQRGVWMQVGVHAVLSLPLSAFILWKYCGYKRYCEERRTFVVCTYKLKGFELNCKWSVRGTGSDNLSLWSKVSFRPTFCPSWRQMTFCPQGGGGQIVISSDCDHHSHGRLGDSFLKIRLCCLMRDFRLTPRNIWELRYSGLLRSK